MNLLLNPTPMPQTIPTTLEKIYRRLLETFGPQHWWPAQTKFEVIVGAILTQNTNWGNVEKALENLKKQKVLFPWRLYDIPTEKLAQLIRPAGYFNVKAKRLKNFMEFFFKEYGGNLKKMQSESLEVLRSKLLSVNGIGPETADSILLYALDKPVFVVDAYTKRILLRHNLAHPDADYHEIQEYFMRHFPMDVKQFNEFHALIVRLGKDYCRTKPRCEQCPLKDIAYSLTYKCRRCHRALPLKKERISFQEGYFCLNCQR